MINLRHVPVVKVLIPFALGSLSGYKGFIEIEPLLLVLISFSVWGGLLLFYRLSRGGKGTFYCCFSLSVLLLFFFTGLGSGSLARPKDPGIFSNDYVVLKGRVSEEPVLRNGKLVFSVKLRMSCTEDRISGVRTLVKTYMQEPAGSLGPEVGEMWIFCGRLYPIKNAGNPGEVDYAAILKRKNCWYRFYCDTTGGLNRKEEELSRRIPGPGEIRKVLSGYWEGSPRTISLLKAVCLGDRSGLREDLQEAYSLAGGMHVLAVSGLHVGLIWLVLNRVFSFIVILWKKEVYRAVLITLILWVFAYVTGFSSSVSRSVTMFTFYSLSRIMNHRGHSVNAILFSMFMLILIHPGRLMDVGFQLSYAAILSIVTLNPIIVGVWRPQNIFIRWCWKATVLSLSAQIGTLPLVIFYFHQVPVYALLTNLFAIPLLSFIITVFVVFAPLTYTGLGVGIVNSLLMTAGGAMNSLMELIASFPGSIVRGLFTDGFTSWMLMIILFLGILFLNNRKRGAVYILIVAGCILSVWLAGNRTVLLNSSEARISHFRGGSLLTFREGLVVDHYILSADPKVLVQIDSYLSEAWGGRNYEVSVLNLKEMGPEIFALCGGSCAVRIYPEIWLVGNKRSRVMVVAGTPGNEATKILSGLNPDFLLISGEPFIHQKELLTTSGNVIVDGSCRGWYSKNLGNAGQSFYNTAIRGAFIIHP
jgi:competence protein ComEC